MIVCSCNIITDRAIAEAISTLRTADPFVVITPGLIFKTLRKRPQCGSCLPLVTRIMLIAGGEVMDNMGGGPSHPHAGEPAIGAAARRLTLAEKI